MKNKIMSFLCALCLVISCAFLITACGGSNCEHVWSVTRQPSISMDGQMGCKECGQDGAILPKLNNTDYEVNSTNPDYITYTYTKDGNSYKFCTSNFEFDYTQSEGGEVCANIRDYNGTSTEIIIPDMVVSFNGDVPVKYISGEAFANNDNITSVTLPSSLIGINYKAFYGCSQLSSINFEEGLEQIGSESFSGTALTEVVIPDSVTLIGGMAFAGCNLEKISLPNNGNLGRIGSLFGNNPNSNESVPDSLKEVIITGNGDSITLSVFEGCDKIEKVVLNDEIESLGVSTFAGCTSLKEVVLGTSLKTIGNGIFFGCTALEDIMLPATVEFIDNSAFYNCTALETVYYGGTRAGWNNIDIVNNMNNNHWLTDATRYYYSDTQPSVEEYLENDKVIDVWHYDNNNNVVMWTLNFTDNVDGKTFVYSHSEVEAEMYYMALQEAESLGILEDMFDADSQIILEMYRTSANVDEFEEQLCDFYATQGAFLTVSFANNQATLAQTGNSVDIDYIEVDSAVYYTLTTEVKAFTYSSTDNILYEEIDAGLVVIRHIYNLSE